MNHITTSTGERITRSAFDSRIRKAKQLKIEAFMIEFGFLFCEDCGVNEKAAGKLDCSHDESVNYCIKNGYPEKAYEVDNMKLRCRKCHSEYDKNAVQWTK